MNELTLEEIEVRKAEIAERFAVIETELPEAEEERLAELQTEVEGLQAERDALVEREEAINKAAEERAAKIQDVITHGTESRHNPKEDKQMEVRNTPEYINAYAEYIKTNNDAELRKLTTELATNGTVPVPELVEDIVRTAWEREDIMSRVRKTYVKGVLKVGFEIMAGAADIHEEGKTAITDEVLELGIATLTPVSIKKMIHISDEVYDLRGEAFLRYIYDELTHRIAKRAADELVANISALNTTPSTTAPAARVITAAPAVGVIAQAIGDLSDEATNPVVIMNKATWSAFKSAAYAAQYAVDPFEGLTVLFNDSLSSYANASSGEVYAIVGDLEHGALANFPNGEDIDIKVDELSEAEADLVKIIGRLYVAVGAVTPFAFANIAKA